MKAINSLSTYIFVAPVIYLISVLPFPILYLLSDIAYFLGFKLFKYRTDLVKKNMTTIFPEKSEEEIDQSIKKFYRNFFDIMFETVKLLVVSKKQIRSRMREGEMEILKKYNRENQSVFLAIGHIGNWELGAASYAIGDYPWVRGVYKPLSSKFFDNMMIRIRTRFGGEVYPMEETVERIRMDADNVVAVGLLADQSPAAHKAYWHRFMGIETPVFTSVEMLSKRFNYPVVYLKFDRLGRGRYEMNAELITDDPSSTGKFEITHKYFELLERDIRNQPDNWLWTHNRWKRVK